MNFSFVFHLFAITNILIISFIGIGAAGDYSDSEISEEEIQRMRIKKGKLPVNEEYVCRSAKVPVLTEADQLLIAIRESFENNIYKDLPTEFEWYTEQQKLNLCRRVWSAYTLKIDALSKTVQNDQLENCEKGYNVKKIGNDIVYRVNVKIDEKQMVESVPVLGCHLEEKYSVIGLPVHFNVFITPHQMHNAYYLLRYYELKSYYYVVDLIENIELPRRNRSPQKIRLPQKSALPQRSTFVNTLTQSILKTYSSFKKGRECKKKLN